MRYSHSLYDDSFDGELHLFIWDLSNGWETRNIARCLPCSNHEIEVSRSLKEITWTVEKILNMVSLIH